MAQFAALAIILGRCFVEDRIRTLHPQGKQGTQISRAKYDQMRQAILEALQKHGDMTFSELGQIVEKSLTGRFKGSIGWYYTTVKLDLEARGIIERMGKGSPQRIHLVSREQ